MILSQLSWPVFMLFLFSLVFILFKKREHLSLFFGFVFIAYFFLYTLVEQQVAHRYTMVFYPTIAIFLSQFICSIFQKFKRRHFFGLTSSVLIAYLALLCIVPRSSTELIIFKYTDWEIQQFPVEEAAEWILSKTSDDKIVLAIIRGLSDEFYFKHTEIPRKKFPLLSLGHLYTLWPSDDYDSLREILKEQCKKLNVSYIMFPVTDALISHPVNTLKIKLIMDFLKEDEYSDFIIAAKFNIDDNYIYIYKLRDNFIDEH
jgi:phage shock protein PspC (stress-responsive transcriptional regulator)